MSALPLPANVVEFKLPKRKPKIVEKAAPPDQRSVSVLPIRAITDKRVTDGMFRVLAQLCSFTNRAGITWVSQARLAKDAGVSRQAITKQLGKLRDAGYVEIQSKAFRGERSNTLRVIYDPNLTAEDAIAITSSIEDTRPPEMIKADQRAAQRPPEGMAEDGLPDLSEEQIQANRRRLRDLLSGIGQHGTFRHHEPQSLGDIMATKKSTHRQPNAVAYEEQLHRQPTGVQKGLHRQPHRQPNTVAQNTGERSKEEYLKVIKKKVKYSSEQPEMLEVLAECMTVEQAAEALELVTARYQAEGLQTPTNLAVLVEDMISIHAASHLEASQWAS
ncbi:MAG: helix-turn-helix domain-containing protein [Betaproteobacteria bacterium]|nr:helix-turn-helix domain-containing protein [Betaproteobacteria bacterium]